jgi:curved DNA-binding protein CbpA
MGYHSFSLDPRTVLGVSPTASLDEIHEAYRAKSKKHHPDLGGDEWAFRMVARAYEVLTTTSAPAPRPWDSRGADTTAQGPRPDWTWVGSTSFGAAFSHRDDFAGARASDRDARPDSDDDERPGSASSEAEGSSMDPDEFQTVDVELIWTRFEKDLPGRIPSTQEENDATLSVCMVLSWPPQALVERAAGFTSAGEILRTLIDLFEQLRGQGSVVAARSRIEDGRFVGWLSYTNVLAAQDAFLVLRETFQTRGLTVKLQTRDERVPFDWYGASHEHVMSHAS